MRRSHPSPWTALAVLSAVGAGGCGFTSDPKNPIPDRHTPEYAVAGLGAALTRAESCDDLLTRFQADALAKVEIDTQQHLHSYVTGPYADGYCPGVNDWADAGVSEDFAGPNAQASDGAEDRSSTPDNFSETNTQVEGVDEADIVETDGYHIYVLSGSRLFVLDSWPAEDLAIERSIKLEGYTHEMFVADGRAVVFSSANDPTFKAPSHCADSSQWYGDCYPSRYYTKITVIDAITGTPEIARELYVEGGYHTARRHDEQVRAILSNWSSFYWTMPQLWDFVSDDFWQTDCSDNEEKRLARKLRRYVAIMKWRSAAIAAVKRTKLDEWLPRRYEQTGSELVALAPECENFYLPGPGLVDYGLTQLAGFDLGNPSAPPSQAAVAGYTHAVYAGHDSLLLAQWDWSAWFRAEQSDDGAYESSSLLHRFTLGAGGESSYQGSALIPGNVLNQFALDEKDGIVRAATTQQKWSRDDTQDWWWWSQVVTHNYVLTLKPEGRALKGLGSTPPLAENESIQSARFVGDKAYIVTFRQVDPLFAIDLSDAAHPTVLGELKIPGFSTYMHPLGENHLLTIGFDADEDGFTQGLALQIFDVSNPTLPALAHKHVFAGDAWGSSEANWNHKAFTFYGHLGLLAFPYSAWGQNWDEFRSSLEVFRVGTDTGFEKLGSIDHTALVDNACSEFADEWVRWDCRYNIANVRRGVFIEDNVYSISWGGVLAHNLADLSTPVGSVTLPPDGLRNYYYGWGWWGRGFVEGDVAF